MFINIFTLYIFLAWVIDFILIDFQLFVTRLAQDVTNQEIKEYFEIYGTVTDVTILNQAAADNVSITHSCSIQ